MNPSVTAAAEAPVSLYAVLSYTVWATVTTPYLGSADEEWFFDWLYIFLTTKNSVEVHIFTN